MLIKKFLHSCLLLEENGKRLLIDPGTFCFIEGKLKPQDIGPVDAILITHRHGDHCDPDALRTIMSHGQPMIWTNGDVGAVLQREGIDYQVIADGEVAELAGFTVRSIGAAHGAIPSELPHNSAFLVNEKLLHPGDSYAVHDAGRFDVLALPVTALWGTLVEALEFARKVNAPTVIPIHDAMMKDFMLDRVYTLSRDNLSRHRISFHPLDIGDVLEV